MKKTLLILFAFILLTCSFASAWQGNFYSSGYDGTSSAANGLLAATDYRSAGEFTFNCSTSNGAAYGVLIDDLHNYIWAVKQGIINIYSNDCRLIASSTFTGTMNAPPSLFTASGKTHLLIPTYDAGMQRYNDFYYDGSIGALVFNLYHEFGCYGSSAYCKNDGSMCAAICGKTIIPMIIDVGIFNYGNITSPFNYRFNGASWTLNFGTGDYAATDLSAIKGAVTGGKLTGDSHESALFYGLGVNAATNSIVWQYAIFDLDSQAVISNGNITAYSHSVIDISSNSVAYSNAPLAVARIGDNSASYSILLQTWGHFRYGGVPQDYTSAAQYDLAGNLLHSYVGTIGFYPITNFAIGDILNSGKTDVCFDWYQRVYCYDDLGAAVFAAPYIAYSIVPMTLIGGMHSSPEWRIVMLGAAYDTAGLLTDTLSSSGTTPQSVHLLSDAPALIFSTSSAIEVFEQFSAAPTPCAYLPICNANTSCIFKDDFTETCSLESAGWQIAYGTPVKVSTSYCGIFQMMNSPQSRANFVNNYESALDEFKFRFTASGQDYIEHSGYYWDSATNNMTLAYSVVIQRESLNMSNAFVYALTYYPNEQGIPIPSSQFLGNYSLADGNDHKISIRISTNKPQEKFFNSTSALWQSVDAQTYSVMFDDDSLTKVANIRLNSQIDNSHQYFGEIEYDVSTGDCISDILITGQNKPLEIIEQQGLGGECASDSECLSLQCSNGMCAGKGRGESCQNDYQCLSGSCVNSLCTNAGWWMTIDTAAKNSVGRSALDLSFLSIIIIILLSAAIILLTKAQVWGLMLSAGISIILLFFFTFVGWLSAFIFIAVIFLILGGMLLFFIVSQKGN